MPAQPQFIARDVDVVPAAALLAEPTRAAMLTALLDERPLAAGELARLAGVSPATASSHLARLLGGGLVTMIRQGRHRYYRLAGPEVAAAIEALAQLSPATPVRSLRESRDAAALAHARTCYDHLAGRAGVAQRQARVAPGLQAPVSDGGPLGGATRPADGTARQAPARAAAFRVTEAGSAALAAFGLNVGDLARSRRCIAGACLDWTERAPHLSGALGAAITTRLFGLGWIERGTRRRAVQISPAGHDGLAATFGWSLVNSPAE
jgi:DNA-binding transcriptional ArsR family regulator